MKVTTGNLSYDQKLNYKIIRASFGWMLAWTEGEIPFWIAYLAKNDLSESNERQKENY